ncbi:DUF4397 domain-containing protein [Anaerotignum sp. MB30-C6]|uniref:DUF4397 domain-containing protein n=1 Tax=Anaerotignum sp. MB30-C6 TaxID=3070814 RepID=UPI0027DD1429|nr:DUF4397 domain-containing protein [Anaerotignum sp. MB30-C6]WMI82262.1 DUF4397 domain-containing protein [Anaerotignum sp. MB30-C6]
MTENYENVETSREMIIPLPLTEEELVDMDESALTMEVGADMIRRLYPEINIVPNVKVAEIPIISGITLISYLRFFNAFSSLPAVDVYVNGKKVASDLKYGFFTEYQKAFPGYYKIEVYEAGTTRTPLLVTFINLIGYRIYTAAIIGRGTEVSLELITDSIRPIPKKSSLIRFVQLSPLASVMDAQLDDTLVLSEIDFKEVSRYLTTPPGSHSLKLKDFITGGILAEELEMKLDGGSAYTVYIVGDTSDGVGLQILVEEEGISFLNF